MAHDVSKENERPALISWLNELGSLLGLGPRVSLEVEELIHQAQRSTGLSDWGDEDVRPALEILTRSLKEESNLSTVGRIIFRSYLNRLLSNRLKIQRDLTQMPEIRHMEVKRPLFIIGLPRTGSTLLQRLLARDPSVRSLQTWEMMCPSPPPAQETYLTDTRRRDAERRLKLLNWMAPEFASVHEWTAGEPEECLSLLQATLVSIVFEMMAPVPSYSQWLETQDLHQPYQYYRQQLQLLQYRMRGDHWVLKSPIHLFALKEVLEIFPDARIIMTHRDPVKILPSICSYFAVLYKLHCRDVDLTTLGPYWLEKWAAANDAAIDLREKVGNDRFLDVDYRRLVKEPFGVVKEIYDHFDYELSPEALDAMTRWHANNPQHKHGVHQYSLEQFGLTAEQVDRRFARYVAHFGVPTDKR